MFAIAKKYTPRMQNVRFADSGLPMNDPLWQTARPTPDAFAKGQTCCLETSHPAIQGRRCSERQTCASPAEDCFRFRPLSDK